VSRAANGIRKLNIPEVDDAMDVPNEVCKANNPNWEAFDVKKKHDKGGAVKRKLNREVVKKMP
jgi:hypothetical protein